MNYWLINILIVVLYRQTETSLLFVLLFRCLISPNRNQGRIQDFKLGRGGRETRTILDYFVWKITILRQKIIFFPPGDPPSGNVFVVSTTFHMFARFVFCGYQFVLEVYILLLYTILIFDFGIVPTLFFILLYKPEWSIQ